MDGRKRTWPRVASAFVMAIAVAIVWAMVLMWGGYSFMTLAPTDYVYESVEVTRDGTPVVQSRSNFIQEDTTYRTLDGKPLDIPSEDRFVTSTPMGTPDKPPGLFETSVPWMMRIAGLSDWQRPATSWYLVRDEEPIGRAYFSGYDQTTKLPVGYIGRDGFSRAKPVRDQWFDVGRGKLTYGSGVIADSGTVSFSTKVYSYAGVSEDQHVPLSLAFVIDGERVLAVDLRTRTVQPFYQTTGLTAVAMLYEAPPETATKPPAAATASPPKAPDGLAPAAGASEYKPLLTRIAARSADHIAIFDWPSKNKREFHLPESVRDEAFSVNLLPSNELLLNWSDGNRETTILTWIRPDGTVARERKVALNSPGGGDERTAAWMAAGVAPIPVAWATVVGVIAPLNMIQSNQAASYDEVMAKIFRPSILPFVAVALSGILLAWITFRTQRKYHRPANGVWVTFVLLLGLPGFLAYLIEHRRAKLEACGECGKVVPRDREACAACETEFAAPARVGTEIFA